MQFVPSLKWAKWGSRDFFGCFFLLALCEKWISKKSSCVSSSSLVIHSVLGISVANPWPPNPFVLSICCWKSNLADFYCTLLKFLESGFQLETCICKFRIGFLWAFPIFIKKKKKKPFLCTSLPVNPFASFTSKMAIFWLSLEDYKPINWNRSVTAYSALGVIHILGAKGIIYISAVVTDEFYSHLSL